MLFEKLDIRWNAVWCMVSELEKQKKKLLQREWDLCNNCSWPQAYQIRTGDCVCGLSLLMLGVETTLLNRLKTNLLKSEESLEELTISNREFHGWVWHTQGWLSSCGLEIYATLHHAWVLFDRGFWNLTPFKLIKEVILVFLNYRRNLVTKTVNHCLVNACWLQEHHLLAEIRTKKSLVIHLQMQ